MFTTVTTFVLFFLYVVWIKDGFLNMAIKLSLLMLAIWGLVESLQYWGFVLQEDNTQWITN